MSNPDPLGQLYTRKGEMFVEVRNPHDQYRVQAVAVARPFVESVEGDPDAVFTRVAVCGGWYVLERDGERGFVVLGDELRGCSGCGTPRVRWRADRARGGRCIHCHAKAKQKAAKRV